MNRSQLAATYNAAQPKDIIDPAMTTHSYLAIPLSNSNLLLESGQPLLLLCTRIMQGYYPNELETLKLSLSHESHIFISKCRTRKIKRPITALAIHSLLGTINDILISKKIIPDNLVVALPLNSIREPFFDLIDNLLLEPMHNIDILELIYICLKLGYKGDLNNPNRNEIIETYISNIYTAIRNHKGAISKNLHLNSFSNPQKKHFGLTSFSIYLQKMVILLGAIAICTVIFGTILLDQNITIINQQITSSINLIQKTFTP